jgi:hypothetical protein
MDKKSAEVYLKEFLEIVPRDIPYAVLIYEVQEFIELFI